jgi:protein TonB
MLWYGKLEPKPISPEPERYEVRLVYYTPPEEKIEKRETEKTVVEQTVIEKQPEIKEPEKEPMEEKKEESVEKVIEETVEPENLQPDDTTQDMKEEEIGEISTGAADDTGEVYMKRPDTEEKVTDDHTLYVNELREQIIKKQVYPYAARKKGIQGIVIVQLLLDENGSLLEIKVAQSSGHKLLDRAALLLVKKVLPFEHNTGTSINVEIPIKYSLVN